MTILLTGGAGNLGSRLLVPLIQRGDRVVLFDLPRKPFFGSEEFHQCLFLHGDVCDRDAVHRAVRDHRVDSLFHLGAILSTRAEADPDLAWRVNMDGMRNVLEAARIEGVAKVILASTLATYGPGLASPLQIDAPMWPASLYGVTKVAGECLGSYYHQRFGLDFRAIRFPSIVASRGGAPGAAGRFTAEVFSEAVAHGAYEFYLPPDASIPIIYIEDAIQALVLRGSDHPEHVGVERHHLLITRAPERPKCLEIVDRLEKIRLALGVVADQRDAFRRDLQFLVLEVPKVSKNEPAQPHGPSLGRVPETMGESNDSATRHLPLSGA